jgi:hypothetical protein
MGLRMQAGMLGICPIRPSICMQALTVSVIGYSLVSRIEIVFPEDGSVKNQG